MTHVLLIKSMVHPAKSGEDGMTTHSQRQLRRGVTVLMCVGAMVGLAACSSAGGSSTSSVSGGLPAQIKVVAIRDLTGVSAVYGLSANQGMELAIDQINSQHFLGKSQLMVDKMDSAGSTQTAASMVTGAIQDASVSAIFGPLASAEAVATAPIAENGKTPIIYVQAGSNGVVIGDYTFRATPLQSTYYTAIEGYLKSHNIKKISIIYTSDVPTFNQTATQTYPAMAKAVGFDIVSSIAVVSTTQDFTTPIQRALGAHPDAVAFLGIGAQNATVMQQLRQAGWTGPVIGTGAASLALGPAGQAGAGMVWPTDFSTQETDPSVQSFVSAYRAKYNNEDPQEFAAEGYLAAWWLARAIKAENSASRAGIQAGLIKIAEQGMVSALGAQMKFVNGGRDIQVPGVVVQWNGNHHREGVTDVAARPDRYHVTRVDISALRAGVEPGLGLDRHPQFRARCDIHVLGVLGTRGGDAHSAANGGFDRDRRRDRGSDVGRGSDPRLRAHLAAREGPPIRRTADPGRRNRVGGHPARDRAARDPGQPLWFRG
jgi:branched-chain amino acid transport system substrate-binding protein